MPAVRGQRSPYWQEHLPTVERMAREGYRDADIAERLPDCTTTMVTNARKRWNIPAGDKFRPNRVMSRPGDSLRIEDPETTKLLTRDDISRITSLDDLLTFFKVNQEQWDVRDFKVNKWEQASGNNKIGVTVTPLYQVSASLVRSASSDVAIAERVIADMLSDAAGWSPFYKELAGAVKDVAKEREPLFAEPVLMEHAVYDPHIGMYADADEVGKDYDTKLAVDDFITAHRRLLRYSSMYQVERFLLVMGNDFLHVDGPAGPGTRGGATTAGTQQDIDTRLWKMFTRARRAATISIDMAATIAPVTVICVPGNHDAKQTYAMGEVLSAWYRHNDRVEIIYGPQKRFFWGWEQNAFMFCHGEEYRRQRDSLPLIFSQECPPELWVRSKNREIHTGHNHIGKAGGYVPTRDLDETRAVRTRSLRALTPEDAWHYGEGYRHSRGATCMAWTPSGEMAGYHEVNL